MGGARACAYTKNESGNWKITTGLISKHGTLISEGSAYSTLSKYVRQLVTFTSPWQRGPLPEEG